jgi:hypothetical protein
MGGAFPPRFSKYLRGGAAACLRLAYFDMDQACAKA